MILILALACGIAVSNIYFPQAITPIIAKGLDVPLDSAALVATAAQVGYAAGLFLLVPLGDRVPHRRLVMTLVGLTGLGLLVAGIAPALPVLVIASAGIGLTTVVPQIIIPMAAGLAGPDRRGAVTGTLLSGLIGGILLARTFGGAVGGWLGWRAPYLVAAALALVLVVVLARMMPVTAPRSRRRYGELLAESVRLLRTEPELRRSSFYQATMFAGFTAAWTSLALFLTGPDYRLGPQAVGLLALVGAGSVFSSPIAGRVSDQRGPDRVTVVCLIAAVLAAGVLAGGAMHGVPGFVILAAGMLVLDIAMQSGQVANQARIFALRPEIRSRLNTAYMTCAFIGGSVGSWLGVRAYERFGWLGVCGLVAACAVAGLAGVRAGAGRSVPVPVAQGRADRR